MKPSELDTLEQHAARYGIRCALLLAYDTGRADAFIEVTTDPVTLSLLDRVSNVMEAKRD